MNQTRTFRSKKEFAYDVLRENILNGELKPGSRLIIDDLAKDLEVSPIPVREALQRLQSDGFVTIEPYVGATVTDIHADLIQEVFELLTALEDISGRAACQRMSPAEFEELEALLKQMDQDVGDLDLWSQDNVKLHQLICQWAGMSLTQILMERVVDHWDWLRRHYLEEVFTNRVHIAQRDHWHLFEALQTRSPDQVSAVIHQHNQKALTSYKDYLTQQGKI